MGTWGERELLPVLKTGVAGLDEILGGGVPTDTMTLILGIPGAGKTILASEIAFRQAHKGARVVVFTAFSEAHDRLLLSLRQFAFYDDALIGDRIQFISIQTVLREGLSTTVEAIVDTVRAREASVVVLDGFRGMAGFADNDAELRQFLYEMRTQLALLGATTFVTLETGEDREGAAGTLTIADSVIGMHNTPWGVRRRRHVEIQKLRGMAHMDGLHTIGISETGVTCYPRHEAVARTVNYALGVGRAGTSLPELDQMLQGGPNRGTVTLLAGSVGSGKTLTGLHFIVAGAEAGEPGLMVSFNESAEQLYIKAAHFGLDLRGLVARGVITLLCLAPVEMEIDKIAATLREHIERLGILRLVIDSVLDLEQAILEPYRAPGFFASLINYLREHNVTTILIRETTRTANIEAPPDSAASIVVTTENIIAIRRVVYTGKMYRVISVLKMRQSAFDRSIRELRIEDGTIRVLPSAESGDGVLRGIETVTGLDFSE